MSLQKLQDIFVEKGTFVPAFDWIINVKASDL